MRCLHGCKKSDFYLLEQERCDWLVAHKLCGKANYVTETLMSMETFYDTSCSNYDREGMRNNRFNALSTDGNAITYNKMNEDLNAWNKSSKDTAKFKTVGNMIIFSHCVSTFELISVGYVNIGM